VWQRQQLVQCYYRHTDYRGGRYTDHRGLGNNHRRRDSHDRGSANGHFSKY